MTAYIELAASWLLANAKGRDAKLFCHGYAPFTSQPLSTPNITVTSPLGPSHTTSSPTILSKKYMAPSTAFPPLSWTAPDDVLSKTKEWLLVSEDPDVPFSRPAVHGIFLGIPKSTKSLQESDLEPYEGGINRGDKEGTKLKGGFYYGRTLFGAPYVPARPLMGHGPHRYFYQVIALSEPLDPKFIATKPWRDAVLKEIDGKVLGWGEWVAACERRWGD